MTQTEQKPFDKKDFLIRYLIITGGCMIYALGVSLFLDPNDVAAGGVTGISIVLSYLITPHVSWLDTALFIVLLNVPMFILGIVFFGKRFALSTMYSTLVSSGFIKLFKYTLLPCVPQIDRLVAGIIGGALFGVGLGLVFRMGSTTGGTDVILKLLRKRFRYIRIGVFSMTLDTIIVGVAAVVFRDFRLACYTVISIAVFTFLFDAVIYGGNAAKMAYIITTADKSALLCDKILNELEVGATIVDGQGAYSGSDRHIILCVVKTMHYPRLRDVVKEVDPSAFMIVSSAQEIYGEGYKPHNSEEV